MSNLQVMGVNSAGNLDSVVLSCARCPYSATVPGAMERHVEAGPGACALVQAKADEGRRRKGRPRNGEVGPLLLQCPGCPYVSLKTSSMVRHSGSPTGCLSVQQNLVRHDTPRCILCRKLLQDFTQLGQHIQKIHRIPISLSRIGNTARFRCFRCPFLSSSEATSREHGEAIPNSCSSLFFGAHLVELGGRTRKNCPFCPFYLPRNGGAKAFIRHVYKPGDCILQACLADVVEKLSETGWDEFSCPKCGQYCSKKNAFLAHIRASKPCHKDIFGELTLFRCGQCGIQVDEMKKLDLHVKSQYGCRMVEEGLILKDYPLF